MSLNRSEVSVRLGIWLELFPSGLVDDDDVKVEEESDLSGKML